MYAIYSICILVAGAAITLAASPFSSEGITFHCPNCNDASCVKIGPGDLATGQVINCEKCQFTARAERMFNTSVYLPICDKKNMFAHRQYDDFNDQTFCVELNGNEIPGSRQKGRNGNCDKFPRKHTKIGHCDDSKDSKSEYKQCCRADGCFEPRQCDDGFCWCVTVTGHLIPRTLHKGSAIDCAKLQAFTFDCKGKNGTFENPTDPTRYIRCQPCGTSYHCACFHGMVFNATEGMCMPGTEKPNEDCKECKDPCSDGTGIVIDDNGKPRVTSPDPCKGKKPKPDPNNRNAYFKCVNGTYIKHFCPKGLVWDKRLCQCDWPRGQPNPGESQTTTAKPTTTTPMPTTEEPTTTTPMPTTTTPMPTTEEPTTTTKDHYYKKFVYKKLRGTKDCFFAGKLVAHETDCSKYYICTGSRSGILSRCPGGLLFNAKIRNCDKASNVQC